MKWLLIFLLVPLWALAETRPVIAKAAPSDPASLNDGIHFVDTELSEIIRTLGAGAKMSVVVGPEVSGKMPVFTVGDRSYRDALDVVIQANSLVCEELNGVYYIRRADYARKEDADRIAYAAKLQLAAYLEAGFTRAEAMELMIRLPGGVLLNQAERTSSRAKNPKTTR